ncbi:MAG: MCE family protein [Acidobacteria bacterium]|jgi:phospholipid/cholesterol/gamma-HCH transport system substrate-binding protein|nr:MCE family protein [Acidobacteriota bacterium]
MPSTQKNLGFSQLRVGLFVLAGLLILGFLILNSTGDLNPFEKKLHLRARFPEADGLHEGADVQIAGVHIGKVERVALLETANPDEPKVEAFLTVDSKLDGKPLTERIRTDSNAQMISVSLLANDKMVNISPGTPRGAPVSENFVLNTTPATSITQIAETGGELLDQLTKLSEPANEILNKANRGEGTLGRIVNDESLYRNLDTTVAETRSTMLRLQTTIDKVNSGRGSAGKLLNDPALYDSLNRTVAKLELISGDLRAGRGTAGKLLKDEQLYNDTRAAVADLRVSAAKINLIADDFRNIAADLNAGRGTAGKLLKDEALYNDTRVALDKFNQTADRINIIIGDTQNGKGTIGKLLTDETLYNNVNQTTANINQITTEGTKLIYDFRQNPKKYLTIKFKLF